MNPAALITGAARGLGRSIALALAQLGWDLVINFAQNQTAATDTANEAVEMARKHGHLIRAVICQADVSQAADREVLLARTREAFGRLDLLVNNAGIGSLVRGDLLEAREDSFDRVLDVNLKGPFFLTQAAARWMIEQTQATPAPPRRPRIVIISSISANTASTQRGDYCISKAGLSMLTQLFAARLAEHGINVYEIRPGIMATDLTAPVKEKYDRLIGEGLVPIARWGRGEDVGRAVSAIAQDLLPFSTGEVLHVDGGFHLRRL